VIVYSTPLFVTVVIPVAVVYYFIQVNCFAIDGKLFRKTVAKQMAMEPRFSAVAGMDL